MTSCIFFSSKIMSCIFYSLPSSPSPKWKPNGSSLRQTKMSETTHTDTSDTRKYFISKYMSSHSRIATCLIYYIVICSFLKKMIASLDWLHYQWNTVDTLLFGGFLISCISWVWVHHKTTFSTNDRFPIGLYANFFKTTKLRIHVNVRFP